ncbi:hypothetical protein V7S43_017690 [Phytophthora oleae]|uniref:Uncharacterized protein n=1 Tax=Phytophthora oleae TaxID=2107226 RepID=A0ABD3EVS2_9STRA
MAKKKTGKKKSKKMTDAALMDSGSVHGDEESGELDASAQVNGSNASDPHFLPVNAAKLTQSLIGLSDKQRQVLEKELDLTDEDSLLVLRFNPNWQGQVAVATVCDAIAAFEQCTSRQRGHRWIFHFDHYQDLLPCKTAIRLAHPEAFAVSPDAVTTAVAAGAVRANLQTEPLAYGVVINKIAVHQDDAGTFDFFYL